MGARQGFDRVIQPGRGRDVSVSEPGEYACELIVRGQFYGEFPATGMNITRVSRSGPPLPMRIEAGSRLPGGG